MSQEEVEEIVTHSPHLFIRNGIPIKFVMRPSDEKARHGGGELSSKSSKDSIRLVIPGSKILLDDCVSLTYIMDCVKENKLLDIKDYKVKKTVASDDSDLDDFGDTVISINHKLKTNIRREYAPDEDDKIIDFIIKKHRADEVKGKSLWTEMERLKICPGRTWQSMKNRYIKKILPNVHMYPKLHRKSANYLKCDEYFIDNADFDEKVETVVKDNITANEVLLHEDNAAEENLSLRKTNYTTNHDMAILNYILEERRINNVTGTLLWKEMEAKKVTSHSWQSMKDRFLKRIMPNIQRYKVDNKYERKLSQLIDFLSDKIPQNSSRPVKRVEIKKFFSNDNSEEFIRDTSGINNVAIDKDISKHEVTLMEGINELLKNNCLPETKTSGASEKMDRESSTAIDNQKNLLILNYIPNDVGSPDIEVTLFTSASDDAENENNSEKEKRNKRSVSTSNDGKILSSEENHLSTVINHYARIICSSRTNSKSGLIDEDMASWDLHKGNQINDFDAIEGITSAPKLKRKQDKSNDIENRSKDISTRENIINKLASTTHNDSFSLMMPKEGGSTNTKKHSFEDVNFIIRNPRERLNERKRARLNEKSKLQVEIDSDKTVERAQEESYVLQCIQKFNALQEDPSQMPKEKKEIDILMTLFNLNEDEISVWLNSVNYTTTLPVFSKLLKDRPENKDTCAILSAD